MKSAKSENLKRVMEILGPKYPEHRPFLDYENPFQLLLATVLAAQCMDATVNTVTPELFKRFPDPAALAIAPLGEVERIIKKVTFFKAKAHNIKALSRMLSERNGGEVPDNMEALTAMPGVGRKTAGTILSHIYGQAAIIVDTHFSRVSRRLGLTESDKPEQIEKDIAAISEREDWSEISAVLNRFGRDLCHARNPKCDTCPVHSLCPSSSAS